MTRIGSAVRRKEDPPLLRGASRFVDDLKPPGCLRMGFVHSTEAHARIVGVDVAAARAMPGVVTVVTAADLPEAIRYGTMTPMPPGVRRSVLAEDIVRFVGEPVAVVVADDLYHLADAIDAVVVDYEPLAAAASIDAALADDAPLLFPDLGTNVVAETPSAEDLDEVFAAAPHVIEERFVNQRLSHAPMEPSGVVAEWKDSELTLWPSSQCPHAVRTHLGRLFDVPQAKVRVVVPNVGGAFGAKNAWYPELTMAPYLARELGRPVKYTQFRSQAMQLMCHGRDQVDECELAYDDEGRFLALRVTIAQNCGAYPTVDGVVLSKITKLMASGCYRIPRIAVTTKSIATNTTPTRPYRGAGRPEATYFVERLVERVAAERGIDPLEIRRRNFIQMNEFPYATPPEAGAVYDSGDYPGALDRLLRRVDLEALRKEQADRRQDPSAPLIGIGFCTYVEFGGVGPSSFFKNDVSREVGGWEACTIRVFPDGSATVLVGTSAHGQGHETVFSQIVADQLGIEYDKIQVIHGDTAAVPHGVGTVGSRSMAVGGSAVVVSARKVVDQARQLAAHLMEIPPEDLDYEDGRFVAKGVPSRSMALTDVAKAAYSALELPPDSEAGLHATTFWEPDNFVYSSGAYCCVVNVDPETGRVEIERFVAVDDVGNVLNPLLAEGQVHGGLVQGIAQALFEEVVYDENGQPLNPNFLDYLVPSAPEMPHFETEFHVTPSPVNPLGAKGVGESGTVGAPPAVVNAVLDALAPFGIEELPMPLTPKRIRTAIAAAGAPEVR